MDAKVWVVLCSYAITSAFGISDYQCKIEQPTTQEKRVMPAVHEQFQTGVVATIVENQYTLEIEEFYDTVNNRAAAHGPPHSASGIIMSQFYDFEHDEVYNVFNNGTCITEDFQNNTKVYFQDENGHVLSPSQWMLFGTVANVSYIGNTTIRGIPVNQWSSCIMWSVSTNSFNFKADFYFTSPDYFTTAGAGLEIPVRVEINGTKTSSQNSITAPLHHIYDYVFYRPGPIEDTSVFEIPHGYLCIRNQTKPVPKLPDLMTNSFERIIPAKKHVSFRQMVYDYPGKLSIITLRRSNIDSKQFGHRLLSVIHDYNSGVEYVIDKARKNCTIRNITLHTYDGIIVNDELVKMKHAVDLLYFMTNEWHYQGERKLNDIPCDVWASHLTNSRFNTNNATMVIELFFAKSDWKFGADSKSVNRHPVGTWISMVTNGSIHTVYRTLNFMMTYDVHDISVFDDVHFCYPAEAQRKHCVFKIEGNYDTIVSTNEKGLLYAVRNMLASGAEVEPIRVNDIFFATTSKTSIDVWFTFLDKPKVQGDAVHQLKQTTLDDAFNNLNKKIKKGVTFVVQYDNQNKTLNVIKSSLETDKDALDPRKPKPKSSGYNGGAMAGLGISMLLIGGLIGLVIAYFWVKRTSTAIPYERDQIS